jgi:hypothetical protein
LMAYLFGNIINGEKFANVDRIGKCFSIVWRK